MKVNKITSFALKPYGKVIEYPNKEKADRNKNLFKIIILSKQTGWRIAYLIVREKVVEKLEQHPDSCESFEPVKGKSLIFLSSAKNLKKLKCFLLDKPIILNKGIWHAVVTLSHESEIKITENAHVKCIYWQLGISLPR